MSLERARLAGAVLALLAVVVVVVGYRFVKFWSSPAADGLGRAVFFELKPNSNPIAVARDLETAGAVSNARWFYWYGRLAGENKRIKSADYKLSTAMRPGEVFAVITSGISHGFPLTVPEGYSMAQIAGLIENYRAGAGAQFETLCSDARFIATLGFARAPATLEGYLFPDTYKISPKAAVDEVVRQMVRKHRAVFTPDLATKARAMGFTEHEIVTLASIVEKETGAKHERPLIASVFHNRLRKKMRLQSDPTVIYGVKDYDGNIKRQDLDARTPYNTYQISGLPPGPIANPGRDAILAALNPAQSSYYYFVSRNDGTHEFTATYDDHKRAVAKFQLDRSARAGKSWRDLGHRGAPAPRESGASVQTGR